MELLEFMELVDLNGKSESERAKLICFYRYQEFQEREFSMSVISETLIQCGFSAPNTSRLKDKLLKGKDKSFILVKDDKNKIEFIPVVVQSLVKELGSAWNNTETIISGSELLDENKFIGKRQYLDRLVKQINHTYANNCYDACAVLLRRLFEVLLIMAYQHLGIDNEIKDRAGNGYLMLEGIVNNAKTNNTLKMSRIKNEFDTFRKVGNFSAHNITYTASKKDIDDIKLDYRVMLEELYNKANLM
ncbi:MAG: hypothetical protein K2K70_14270 [Lachnospiraceae bacterium]|nr:hypothetical protein [Lachnospiraceae bacterium]